MVMITTLKCMSPIDGSVFAERPVASIADASAMIARARVAQRDWAARPLADRIALVRAGIAALGAMGDEMVVELAHMMGRPIRYGGVSECASYMADIAGAALAPLVIEDSGASERRILREPHGVVGVIAPWNYPYLTAINTVAPALIAGNNRCDYLDLALCRTGCKDTGRGGALSAIGYRNLTRPKSCHLKKA